MGKGERKEQGRRSEDGEVGRGDEGRKRAEEIRELQCSLMDRDFGPLTFSFAS